MIYLVVLVLLFGGGIFRLWLYQRRQRNLDTVDEFWSGLEQLSNQPEPAPRKVAPRGVARSSGPARRPAPSVPKNGARPAPLDPARREAAKRRIEARRRAMASNRMAS